MNMIQKLKKSKKGFTLVELLVVLVILAILAAAIIPSMMGFIDKAREESAAAECRNVILATDIVVNELYGKGGLTSRELTSTEIAEIKKISGLAGEIKAVSVGADPDVTGHFVVNAAKYTPASQTAATFTYKVVNGKYTWEKGAYEAPATGG